MSPARLTAPGRGCGAENLASASARASSGAGEATSSGPVVTAGPLSVPEPPTRRDGHRHRPAVRSTATSGWSLAEPGDAEASARSGRTRARPYPATGRPAQRTSLPLHAQTVVSEGQPSCSTVALDQVKRGDRPAG